MSSAKYPYQILEQQFIRGTMSVRALAEMNNIPLSTVSSIHAQAKKKDGYGRNWYDKRAEFQSRSSDKTIELLANREANRAIRVAEIKDEFLELIADAIALDRAALKRTTTKVVMHDGEATEETVPAIEFVAPRDLAALMDRFQTLIGQPSVISESRGVNFELHGDLNDEQQPAVLGAVTRLVEISRGRSGPTHRRPVGRSPLPSAEGPREEQLA